MSWRGSGGRRPVIRVSGDPRGRTHPRRPWRFRSQRLAGPEADPAFPVAL